MKLEWGKWNDPERVSINCDWCGETVRVSQTIPLKGEHGTVYRACERCVRAWRAGRS